MTDSPTSTYDDPQISVVIPAFNVADWIGMTLESILTQTENRIEVVIVDDGSTDGTLEVATKFSDTDSRVHVYSNPTKGGAAARNFGISQARGEFLAFADGDDTVPERAYELLLQQANRTGNDMVVGSHVTVWPHYLLDRRRNLPIFDEVREGLTLADEPLFLRDRVCWNRIIRRSTWNRLGIAFSEAKRSNDIQAMVWAYALIAFDVIPEPVYIYRRRVGSSSMTSQSTQAKSLSDYLEQELACAEIVRALQNRWITDRYFRGILEFDVWTHVGTAIGHEGSEFNVFRERLQTLLSFAARDAIRALPVHQQVVYDSVARGDWEAARIALLEQGRPMAAALDAVDAEWIVQSLRLTNSRSASQSAWFIRAGYLKAIIDECGQLSDSNLIHLHRRAVSLVQTGVPKHAFTWRQQQIVLAEVGSASAIRAAMARPEPAGIVRAASAAKERAREIARRELGDRFVGFKYLRARDMVALARRARPRHAKRILAMARRRGKRG